LLLRRVGDRGVSLFSSALLRERIRADDPFFDNDNRPLSPLPNIEPLRDAAVADRFRNITVWLIVISSIVAAAMEAVVRVRVDPGETYVLEWLIAALLSVSLMWSGRSQLRRVSDAMGALGLAWLGGMTGGIIAMLELRLHYPLADPMLRSWDLALGIDGLAIVDMLIRQGQWIFKIMALAYNYTLALFFVGIILLALIGDRVEPGVRVSALWAHCSRPASSRCSCPRRDWECGPRRRCSIDSLHTRCARSGPTSTTSIPAQRPCSGCKPSTA